MSGERAVQVQPVQRPCGGFVAAFTEEQGELSEQAESNEMRLER